MMLQMRCYARDSYDARLILYETEISKWSSKAGDSPSPASEIRLEVLASQGIITK